MVPAATAVKVVVSVSLMLLLVSFAKKLTLYCPMRFGMVKLLLNLIVAPTCVKFNIVELAFGKVMFARTVSTLVVTSVTFAAISIVSVTLKMLPSAGVTLITSGGVVSMVTFRSSVKLLFPALSNAVALKK